jgi:hypothetical protein
MRGFAPFASKYSADHPERAPDEKRAEHEREKKEKQARERVQEASHEG